MKNGRSKVHQALAERLLQLQVNVGLRCVQWEEDLKRGKLTLTSMSLQISGLAELAGGIADMIVKVRNFSSADVIDAIFELESQFLHNQESRKACKGLAEASLAPIVHILSNFILTGDASEDLYNEFFKKHGSEIRFKSIPSYLGSLETDILETGRTVRLAHTLGVYLISSRTQVMNEMATDPMKLIDPQFAAIAVSDALRIANQQLLEKMVGSGDFSKEIETRNEHFLLQRSDWLTDLFESTSLDELEKPIRLLDRNRWMNLIRVHTRGKMSLLLQHFPLEEHNSEIQRNDASMSAAHAISLDRTGMTPSLQHLFTDSVMKKYQTLFRYMFFVKLTEHKLKALWKEFQSLRQIDVDGCLFPCYLLLNSMMHFIHNYMLYLSLDVVRSKDWTFRRTSAEGSVSALKRSLDETLSEVVSEFNLNRPSILKTVERILSTCSLFAAHMTRFVQLSVSAGGSIEERADSLSLATSQEKYFVMVEKFSDAFKTQTSSLIVELKSSAPALLGRLDFNGFFRDRMAIHSR